MKLLARPNRETLAASVAISNAPDSRPRPSGPSTRAVITEVMKPIAVIAIVVIRVVPDDFNKAAKAIYTLAGLKNR
jgi:hypothetical protein